MTWIYEALEIHDRRSNPSGKYRVVRWTDKEPNKLFGLCTHAHPTAEDALCCPVACDILDEEFSDRRLYMRLHS